MLHNTSLVDVENPDWDKFPLLQQTLFEECILSGLCVGRCIMSLLH